jgi:two-component system, cell cycle sensor histidine kinase and response regulator CckA
VETILVVEDNSFVMKPVLTILERAGFKVLSAAGPEEAIRVEADFAGKIHLLLSDVMMPGMSGPDLATKLKKQRPDMHIILMSGYPDGGLLVLNYGWHFIRKPFVAAGLLGRIEDVLHSAVREQGTDHFDTRQ